MRIAHVTATFPPYLGGTGNVAYHNAKVLSERGHQVTVLTARQKLSVQRVFPFQVEYLPATFRLGNAPLTPGLLDRLHQYDVVHLHAPYIFGEMLVGMATRRYRIPLVVTYHQDLIAPGLRGMAFLVYGQTAQRHALAQARYIVATSHDYARHSHLWHWFGDRWSAVRTIPNGVDTLTFRPPDYPAGPIGRGFRKYPYALFVGAMDRAHFFKGVPVFLDALSRVPGLHAVLVGAGEMRPAFERLARPKLADRAHFVGRLTTEDLVLAYQHAVVTVLPSISQGEAFGLVLLESMSSGTPVIASDLPGVRSVVAHGQDGLLVPAKDAKSLAQALRVLMANPVARHRMGQAGRAKVEQSYSWTAIGLQWERLYREVMEA